MPILEKSCLSCHRTGGIAPLELMTYGDAKLVAGLMKKNTASREMPPFPADNSGACNTFRDARWLSGDEIATIGAWADAGAPEGNPADAPPPGTPTSKPLASVDATWDMGADYSPPTSLDDEYRCFVVDPGISADAYLTGFEVHPGDAREVHHIVVFALDSDAAEAEAVQKDAAEPGPGYVCFGGAGVSASRIVVGWAPGVPVSHYPDGTGMQIPGGRKLVMQVHYNLASGSFPDRTSVDVSLATSVTNPANLLGVGAFDLLLPPGQAHIEQIGTSPTGGNFTVYGVFPHMHALGTSLRLERQTDAGSACLIDVPHWNFHWQELYFYEQPVELSAADLLRITCAYDTVGQTKTVTFGEGTGDEMCLAGLYVTASTGSGGGACTHCADVLGGASPKNPCAGSGPLIDAIVACACTGSCASACSSACSGGDAEPACGACLDSSCSSALAACKADS